MRKNKRLKRQVPTNPRLHVDMEDVAVTEPPPPEEILRANEPVFAALRERFGDVEADRARAELLAELQQASADERGGDVVKAKLVRVTRRV
jgi:hypothetical protein